MNVRVVSCNHHTADLTVRERLAFPSEEVLLRAYAALRSRFPASEHVLVSTCNRIELYSAQEESDSAPSQLDVARFLSDFHDVPLDEVLQRPAGTDEYGRHPAFVRGGRQR